MFEKRYSQSSAAPATVIASIFIPLTFLTGLYGMNFEHMPELHTRWGYFVLWGVMAVIAIGQFIFSGGRTGCSGVWTRCPRRVPSNCVCQPADEAPRPLQGEGGVASTLPSHACTVARLSFFSRHAT